MTSENRFEQIAGIALLLLLVIGCFVVLRPFLSALLLALILSYSTWPCYAWCERVVKGRKGMAATLMTSLVAALSLIPIIILGSSLAEQAATATGWVRRLLADGPPDPPGWVAEIPVVGTQLYQYWQGFAHNTTKLLNELASAKMFSDLSQYVLSAGEFLLIGAAVLAQGTLQLALSLFIAFFFYRDGRDGAKKLQSVTRRLWGERGLHVLDVVGATIKSVVYGTIGTAIAQSTLTALGLWLAGVPGVLLLGFVTFLLALTPIGAPLVWLPATLWLFYSGATGWAVFLILWGIFIVGGADNIIRPYFISRGSDLPFVLVFLGVLGGTLAFGFLGLFLGPTLLATGYEIVLDWARVEDPPPAISAEAS
ncbi:MAG TPA: AI-2E family transporter [Candidatus Binatia bacterium]|nr:AI-2E family transporter [Candidatus Binatia bacterium]